MLNTVRPKITKFCMLSERNTGSNWVAALLKVTSPDSLYRGCWAAIICYIWAPPPFKNLLTWVMYVP